MQKQKSNNERRINMVPFTEIRDLEVDIYVDADDGIFKFCMVSDDIIGEDKEGIMGGLNDSGNIDGWVPHLHLYDKGVDVRVCEVSSECYGKSMEINWN